MVEADKGRLTLYLGMSSICPTSGAFDAKAGTAVEQLKDGIRMAKTVGSPVIRRFLGRQDDRGTQGGIETHIKNTVEVCKAVRADALAAGVKIAIENHAGDMQAWELAGLVEAAGPDYVGVNIDPGNATWTLEDPVASLETLAPYVACTSIRDSGGVGDPDRRHGGVGGHGRRRRRLQAVGRHLRREGQERAGVPRDLRRPAAALQLPVRSGLLQAVADDAGARLRPLPRRRQARPAARGTAPLPQGAERAAAEAARQKDTFERSVAYCRSGLGFGIRA